MRSVPYHFQSGAILLILAGLLAACGTRNDFTEARELVQQLQTELQAMNRALAAGDHDTVDEHRAEASRLVQRARHLFEAGNIHNAKDPVVLAAYADVLQQGGDYDLAAGVYQRLTNIFPNDPTLWLNLGRTLSRLGQEQNLPAKQAFERVIELEPGPEIAAAAYTGLAALFRGMGLHAFAQRYYEQALERQPHDFQTRVIIAGIMARQGQIREASQFLEAGGVIPPEYSALTQEVLGAALLDFQNNRLWFTDDPENHYAYARLLVLAGRLGEALPALERTMELDPENHVAWNLLGSVAHELGYTDRARQAYQESLAINPDQPRTRERLQQIPSPDI